MNAAAAGSQSEVADAPETTGDSSAPEPAADADTGEPTSSHEPVPERTPGPQAANDNGSAGESETLPATATE
jgi:hypothetical protein